MLTRREVLRSVGLLGAAVAAPPLVSGCARSGPSSNSATPVPEAGVALADVSRHLGGTGARPAAVSAVQGFTADLYTMFASGNENLVCSPYSVAVALAMARNGARGRTAAEMAEVLQASSLQRFNEGLGSLSLLLESRTGQQRRLDGFKAMVSMDVANSLWGQRGVGWERQFLTALARYYGAGIRLVDYEHDYEVARLAINDWVSEQTRTKIPHLLPSGILNAMTRLVLVNAIYLKAPWEQPFVKPGTEYRPFTLMDGRSVTVPTMQRAMDVVITEGASWRAARVPYAGRKLAMTVVVPESLSQLEASLDADVLQAMLGSHARPRQVTLSMPKWTVRTKVGVQEQLAELGMPTAFDPTAADFSGMTRDIPIFISAVQHEAFIEVDEDGTEAAAATAIGMEVSGLPSKLPPPPPPFKVDKPFLFVLHDVETATPLFIGRVTDPTVTAA